jgi:hypothetical protein
MFWLIFLLSVLGLGLFIYIFWPLISIVVEIFSAIIDMFSRKWGG